MTDEAPSARCSQCEQSLGDPYYTRGQALFCSGCHQRWTGPKQMPGLAAFALGAVVATGLAVVAAAASAAITIVSDMELAIVWIFFGGLIGASVRNRSEQRSSWPFRLLSVAATYLAIALAFLFVVIHMVYAKNPGNFHPRWLKLLPLLLTGPVRVCFESPMAAVIYGFGLWQAWKRSGPDPVQFAGPYTTRSSPVHTEATSE